MKKLTSVHDEYDTRERLRKTRLHLNAHINLAAALMEPKPWVGLTDNEVYRIAFELEGDHWRKVADAIEAKLKEKNNG